jgi:hypothetical protein
MEKSPGSCTPRTHALDVHGLAVYAISTMNEERDCVGWLDEYHVALLRRLGAESELSVYEVELDFRRKGALELEGWPDTHRDARRKSGGPGERI